MFGRMGIQTVKNDMIWLTMLRFVNNSVLIPESADRKIMNEGF